jgi:hypothetical protein
MCCDYSRKKLAKISAIIVLLRNVLILGICWWGLYEERKVVNEVVYILGRLVDVYVSISFIGVCQLLNGIKVVREFSENSFSLLFIAACVCFPGRAPQLQAIHHRHGRLQLSHCSCHLLPSARRGYF